jgi:hypothetical protein
LDCRRTAAIQRLIPYITPRLRTAFRSTFLYPNFATKIGYAILPAPCLWRSLPPNFFLSQSNNISRTVRSQSSSMLSYSILLSYQPNCPQYLFPNSHAGSCHIFALGVTSEATSVMLFAFFTFPWTWLVHFSLDKSSSKDIH